MVFDRQCQQTDVGELSGAVQMLGGEDLLLAEDGEEGEFGFDPGALQDGLAAGIREGEAAGLHAGKSAEVPGLDGELAAEAAVDLIEDISAALGGAGLDWQQKRYGQQHPQHNARSNPNAAEPPPAQRRTRLMKRLHGTSVVATLCWRARPGTLLSTNYATLTATTGTPPAGRGAISADTCENARWKISSNALKSGP